MKTDILANNVKIHYHPTSKFKDITIAFRFMNSLETINRPSRYYLAQLLSDTCKKYPTKDAVTRVLDENFGANFKSSGDTVGSTDLLEFRCTMLNGQYVNQDLLSNQIELIHDFIYDPNFIDNSFTQTAYEEIKERLLLMVRSYNDQPSNYAYNQARIAFGEQLKIKALPSIQEIEECTLEDVNKAYFDMIEKDALEIFVLGEFNQDDIEKCIKEKFTFTDRPFNNDIVQACKRNDLTEIIDKKPIHQSRVVFIYQTNQTIQDDDYDAILVGNGLFGGLPTSFLFQEVREKNSLCYTISSRYDGYDGIMVMQTAIDGQNYERVKELVNQQFNRVVDGDFDEQHLETTKKMYINTLRSSLDAQKSIIAYDYRVSLLGSKRSVEETIEHIKTVTKEEIIQAFKKIECKLHYCLTQEETHD